MFRNAETRLKLEVKFVIKALGVYQIVQALHLDMYALTMYVRPFVVTAKFLEMSNVMLVVLTDATLTVCQLILVILARKEIPLLLPFAHKTLLRLLNRFQEQVLQ